MKLITGVVIFFILIGILRYHVQKFKIKWNEKIREEQRQNMRNKK
jgi:hypothetical protein